MPEEGMTMNETDEPRAAGKVVIEALDRHEKALVLYTTQILGDLERARDVVQDAFLKLCNQDPPPQALREWLFTVCRNRAFDVLRKEKRMAFGTESEPATQQVDRAEGPADLADRNDRLRNVLDEVSRLPERDQEILRLKFQQGLSYREIGKVTGLSISHVGVILHEALGSLRSRLDGSRALQPRMGGES